MTSKKLLLGLAVLVLISSLIGVGYCTKLYSKEAFQVQITEVNNGYGYQIYYNKQLYIEQKFVPGVSGNETFVTPDDAKKVADYVIRKLSRKEDPTISQSEIHKILQ